MASSVKSDYNQLIHFLNAHQKREFFQVNHFYCELISKWIDKETIKQFAMSIKK